MAEEGSVDTHSPHLTLLSPLWPTQRLAPLWPTAPSAHRVLLMLTLPASLYPCTWFLLSPQYCNTPALLSSILCCCSLTHVSDSLQPHERQHTWLSCPSLFSKLLCIESMIPSNRLILCCPFSYCPQSLEESESFPVRQFFASGGQNIGSSVSAPDLSVNIQWFPLGLTGLISSTTY